MFDATSVTEPLPRILIAGASSGDREKLTRLLQGVPCDIRYADDGWSAFRAIMEEGVDLLVTEIDMQPVDGLRLIAALGVLPVEIVRPEVIVWAKTTPHDRALLREVAAVIPKAESGRLVGAVRAILEDPLAFVSASAVS